MVVLQLLLGEGTANKQDFLFQRDFGNNASKKGEGWCDCHFRSSWRMQHITGMPALQKYCNRKGQMRR